MKEHSASLPTEKCQQYHYSGVAVKQLVNAGKVIETLAQLELTLFYFQVPQLTRKNVAPVLMENVWKAPTQKPRTSSISQNGFDLSTDFFLICGHNKSLNFPLSAYRNFSCVVYPIATS